RLVSDWSSDVCSSDLAAHLVRDEGRARRGGGKVQAEADFPRAEAEEDVAVLAQIIGPEPTPALAAQVAEEYRRLLDKLGKDDLRSEERRVGKECRVGG